MVWKIDKDKKTDGGVYWDLNYSEYFATIGVKGFNVHFLFSSEFYLDKFLKEIDDVLEKERKHLSHRLKLDIGKDFDILIALKHYRDVEHRGYMIEMGGALCINENQAYEYLKKILMK